MKSLLIKDLSRTQDLDRNTMAAVTGGMYKGGAYFPLAVFDASKHSSSFDATQLIGQSQNTLVNNGNNAAFVSGISSTVKPTQTANNTINFA